MAVAPVLFVVALLVWWTHPSLPTLPASPGFSAAAHPVAEAALTVPVTSSPLNGRPRSFDVHGARPHFTENSAHAKASFWICQNDDGGLLSSNDPREDCRRLRPLDADSDVISAPDGRGEFVVMTLTPTRPGTARVTLVELDYGYGWDRLLQRGTEHVEMDVRLRAT
jgi:hypothetical protein